MAHTWQTPFLDVLSSVANENVNPNVADDRVEWGDPTVPEERRAIEAYDPYSNVGAHAYPPMLVVGESLSLPCIAVQTCQCDTLCVYVCVICASLPSVT